jgi:hypothetical protein
MKTPPRTQAEYTAWRAAQKARTVRLDNARRSDEYTAKYFWVIDGPGCCAGG